MDTSQSLRLDRAETPFCTGSGVTVGIAKQLQFATDLTPRVLLLGAGNQDKIALP